jgi:hypothetical protein
MSEELSGRPLEIATARALGFRFAGDPETLLLHLLDPDGDRVTSFYDNEVDLWAFEGLHYLTDGNAFASVLAALDAAEVAWELEGPGRKKLAKAEIFAPGSGPACRGATYQEAMCRCFVNWSRSK